MTRGKRRDIRTAISLKHEGPFKLWAFIVALQVPPLFSLSLAPQPLRGFPLSIVPFCSFFLLRGTSLSRLSTPPPPPSFHPFSPISTPFSLTPLSHPSPVHSFFENPFRTVYKVALAKLETSALSMLLLPSLPYTVLFTPRTVSFLPIERLLVPALETRPRSRWIVVRVDIGAGFIGLGLLFELSRPRGSALENSSVPTL